MRLLVIVGAVALALWWGLRRVLARRSGGSPGTASDDAGPGEPAQTVGAAPLPQQTGRPPVAVGRAAVDVDRLQAASGAAAARLWKLAFSAPSQGQASDLVNRRVRENIVAMLQVDSLDPRYFPRRPALMPQLLQAVNDPATASDKLSRIVAHDPVLAVDVLQLANSSLYRVSAAPIESIQRAIVVCGVDALRGMLAAAMLKPVFKATSKNFPRLPRMLWDRTERAVRAAELYTLETHAEDRFEAQMVVLVSALGPLVVYAAALDVYARNPHFSPNGDLCVELITQLAPGLAQHIARDWQATPRLIAALENAPDEPLSRARHVGELFGSLSFLESQTVLDVEARRDLLAQAGLDAKTCDRLWTGLTGNA